MGIVEHNQLLIRDDTSCVRDLQHIAIKEVTFSKKMAANHERVTIMKDFSIIS